MEIFYRDHKLYINVEEEINRNLTKEIRRRMSYIVDAYVIDDIILNFLNNTYYNKEIIRELINECKDSYKGHITIK